MKVKELRNLLKDKDIKDINDAFVEVYKALPKAKKEEIDPYIISIINGEGKKKPKPEELSLPELFDQISFLINNAYLGNYIGPNRIIPKRDRFKWRFQVKRYLKVLLAVSAEDENFATAVNFIEEIYRMLAYGCGIYIFSSDDPFASVGISQVDLYEQYVSRQMQLEINEEVIQKMVNHAVDCYLSRTCLHIELYSVLNYYVCQNEYRTMVLAYGKQLIKSQHEKLSQLKKYDDHRYTLIRSIEEMNDLIFIFEDNFTIKTLSYYFKSRFETKDTTFEKAIKLVELFKTDKDWLITYKYGIKRKIQFSDKQNAKYKKLLNEIN